jgi:large subunit ribosomal protein L29
MKASDIREQTAEELETRLNDVKKDLFTLKFQKAIGQLENTQAIRNLRKDIALVETILREKELGINADKKSRRPGPAKKKAVSRTSAKKAAPGKSDETKTKSKGK